ncbi:MAG: AAA family ATPase [Pseudonocardiaceae bacterium]
MGNSAVVVFTGLPGTGKSTMADLTAKTMAAPAFAGDWLLGALTPAARALAQLDRQTYLELYHGLLRSLITRQLLLRQSAIVDCLVPDDVLDAWRLLAADHEAQLSVVECVCTDVTVHRGRVEGRVRNIPGWHEVGWDHVQRMRAEVPALRTERLIIDALEPVDHNLQAVLTYVQSARSGIPR